MALLTESLIWKGILNEDVKNFAVRMERQFGGRCIAEDLLHDTVLRAVSLIPRSIAIGNITAFLCHILRNLARDNSRATSRHAQVVAPETFSHKVAADASPVANAVNREDAIRLLKRLNDKANESGKLALRHSAIHPKDRRSAKEHFASECGVSRRQADRRVEAGYEQLVALIEDVFDEETDAGALQWAVTQVIPASGVTADSWWKDTTSNKESVSDAR